jgi:hypothetical protein
MIENFPDFMDTEDIEGEEDTPDDFVGSGDQQSGSGSLPRSTAQERLDILESTLCEHGCLLTEQGNLQREMLRILHGLIVEKEAQQQEPLPTTTAGTIMSPADFNSLVAATEELPADEGDNDDHNPGPALVLPGYNLEKEGLLTGGRGEVSALHMVHYNIAEPVALKPVHYYLLPV